MCKAAWLSQSNEARATCGTLKSSNIYRNQVNFKHVFSIARYSAFVDDLETFACFLDFHEMREFLRKTQYHVTNLLEA